MPRLVAADRVGDLESVDAGLAGDLQRVAQARVRARHERERAARLIERQALCPFEDDIRPRQQARVGGSDPVRKRPSDVDKGFDQSVVGEQSRIGVGQRLEPERGAAHRHPICTDPPQQRAQAVAVFEIRDACRKAVFRPFDRLADPVAARAVTRRPAGRFNRLIEDHVVGRRDKAASVGEQNGAVDTERGQRLDLVGQVHRAQHDVAGQERRGAVESAAADMVEDVAPPVRCHPPYAPPARHR